MLIVFRTSDAADVLSVLEVSQMNTWIWLAVVVVALVVVAAIAWTYLRKQRSQQLRQRFGPEYQRVVKQYGSESQAEQVLAAREKRVEQLNIHPLAPGEQDRFAERWRSVQAQFVDDPGEAVAKADQLVKEVMKAEGYPMGNFEERAADISVQHPAVVENYRKAHKIELQREEGKASTEDLRNAMVAYRALFEELLGTPADQRREAQR
jgi:hypothetical protein